MYLAPPCAATAKKTLVSIREVNCCTAWIKIFTTPTEGTVEDELSPAIVVVVVVIVVALVLIIVVIIFVVVVIVSG